jgi:hypothetical protein
MITIWSKLLFEMYIDLIPGFRAVMGVLLYITFVCTPVLSFKITRFFFKQGSRYISFS